MILAIKVVLPAPIFPEKVIVPISGRHDANKYAILFVSSRLRSIIL
jgi:hypothetical protein